MTHAEQVQSSRNVMIVSTAYHTNSVTVTIR